MPGNPNTIVSVNDEQNPPLPAPPREILRTIGLADGRTIQVAYGPDGGGPQPRLGEDGSWMLEPNGLNGARVVGSWVDNTTADNFRQQGAQSGPKSDVVTSHGQPGQIVTNPDGSKEWAPLQGSPGAAPPKNYTLHPGPGGTQIIFDSSTGIAKPLMDANGQPVTDPMVAAQHVAAINASNASTASTYSGIQIAQDTNNRNTAIYNRDTTRQQYLDDLALQQEANRQGGQRWDVQQQLLYTQPRQAAIDANQARAYQSQEAERGIQAANYQETAGRQAGQDAATLQQWMLQHTVTPQQRMAMSNIATNPGLAPNPAAFTQPMPDMAAIIEEARRRAAGRIPSYQQSLAATPAYPSFQPDTGGSLQYYNERIAPSAFFPRAIGLPG